MSNDCKRVECDECLPLFRYFVNQQPAIVNGQQVITPDCPQGYDCGNRDGTYIIPETTLIPDVGPNDPDIDPECDYECDNDIFYNNYSGLRPTLYASNTVQTVTCQDLDPLSTGTESYTVSAGTFTIAYDNPSLLEQAVAEANIRAFELGKSKLQEQLDSGEKNCYNWLTLDNSDGCATQGGAVVGEPLTFDFVEATWDYDVANTDGETCFGYTRVDTTRYKFFGPFATDMTVLIVVAGSFFESDPFLSNSIHRCCLKRPDQLGSTTPPISMLIFVSGALFPGTTLLSWGGLEPPVQQTSAVLPAGDQIVLLVGMFCYGQVSGPPTNSSGTQTGAITFTPVP